MRALLLAAALAIACAGAIVDFSERGNHPTSSSAATSHSFTSSLGTEPFRQALPLADSCPWWVERFSQSQCEAFVEALDDSGAEKRMDKEASSNCLQYITVCVINSTVHGVQVLRDTWDFETFKCSKKVRHLSDYNVSFVEGDGSVSRFVQQQVLELSAGEEKRISGIRGRIDGSDEADYLRIKLKDGDLTRPWGEVVSGYFAHFEVSTGGEDISQRTTSFSSWLHISEERAYPSCPFGPRGIVSAEYTVYADPMCANANYTVSHYEADGLCSDVTISQGGGLVSGFQGAALCDGDHLYIGESTTNRSRCLENANTTIEFVNAAVLKMPLSRDRGQCRVVGTGSSMYGIKLSARACMDREPICAWKAIGMTGDRVAVDENAAGSPHTPYSCLLAAQRKEQEVGRGCGVVWRDPGLGQQCHLIMSGCQGTLSEAGEWSCLVRSPENDSNGGSGECGILGWVLIFMMVVSSVGLILIYVARHERNKAKLRAERERADAAVPVDSGRTTGVVTGVPVPNIRPLYNPDQCSSDEEAACTPANPLQQFNSEANAGVRPSRVPRNPYGVGVHKTPPPPPSVGPPPPAGVEGEMGEEPSPTSEDSSPRPHPSDDGDDRAASPDSGDPILPSVKKRSSSSSIDTKSGPPPPSGPSSSGSREDQ